MTNRRTFFRAAGATFLGAAAVSQLWARPRPEAVIQTAANTAGPTFTAEWPSVQSTGDPQWLVTPWRMKDGVKEFHLVAEPVVREIAPGMNANLWGYNGSSPGPRSRPSKATGYASSSPTSCLK